MGVSLPLLIRENHISISHQFRKAALGCVIGHHLTKGGKVEHEEIY